MDLTKFDAVMFIYNYALVISSGIFILTIGIQEKEPFLVASLLPAAVWTLYFKYRMLPRTREPESS